jgi:hypothetical protein
LIRLTTAQRAAGTCSAAPAEYPVTVLHLLFHVLSMKQLDPPPLRVVGEFKQFNLIGSGVIRPLKILLKLGTFSSKTQKKAGGEGRNRTRSPPITSLNILIYRAILTLVLQGFKRFLPLSANYRI